MSYEKISRLIDPKHLVKMNFFMITGKNQLKIKEKWDTSQF